MHVEAVIFTHPIAPPLPSTEDSDGWLTRGAKSVWSAVKWIFKALAGVVLFVANDFFFTVGFLAGIMLPDKLRGPLRRIQEVWDKQSKTAICLIGIAAFLAQPITLSSLAFLYGAKLGCHLSGQTGVQEANVFAI